MARFLARCCGEAALSLADERIDCLELREAAEIAIGSPKFANAVLKTDRRDAGVVDKRTSNVSCKQ